VPCQRVRIRFSQADGSRGHHHGAHAKLRDTILDMGLFESWKPRKPSPEDQKTAQKDNVDAHLDALRAMEKLAEARNGPEGAQVIRKAREQFEKGN